MGTLIYGKVHNMPKPGFKSITISEAVYDKFNQTYQKNKDELTMKGVNSFAGYVTYLLEDVMKKDKTFARYAPKLEKVQWMQIESFSKTILRTELLKLQSKIMNFTANFVKKKTVYILAMSLDSLTFMKF